MITTNDKILLNMAITNVYQKQDQYIPEEEAFTNNVKHCYQLFKKLHKKVLGE